MGKWGVWWPHFIVGMNKILQKKIDTGHTPSTKRNLEKVHGKITHQSTKLLDDNRKTLDDLQWDMTFVYEIAQAWSKIK